MKRILLGLLIGVFTGTGSTHSQSTSCCLSTTGTTTSTFALTDATLSAPVLSTAPQTRWVRYEYRPRRNIRLFELARLMPYMNYVLVREDEWDVMDRHVRRHLKRVD